MTDKCPRCGADRVQDIPLYACGSFHVYGIDGKLKQSPECRMREAMMLRRGRIRKAYKRQDEDL